MPDVTTMAFWIGAALVAIVLAEGYIARIPEAAAWLWRKVPAVTPSVVSLPAVADDVRDLSALAIVEKRYIRMNCDEGKAAVVKLYKNFFHDAGEH